MHRGPPRQPSARRSQDPQWLGAAVCLTLSSGCGAALPVLAPAHTLAPGRVEIATGLAAARNQPTLPNVASEAGAGAAPLSGATLLRAATSRSVAPWVSPRVGLPLQNEIWGFYSGGAAGLGVRHAHISGGLALSVGLEGAWLHLRAPSPDAPTLGGTDAASNAHTLLEGWSAQLPVVFGFRSKTDLVSGWLLARGRLASVHAEPTPEARALDRALGLGIGASVGIRPIWARVELVAEQHWLQLIPEGTPRSRVNGVTFTPSAALAFRF